MPSSTRSPERPRVPDRDAMNAILFVLRTGCQWNALNGTGICSSSSAHRRFLEWAEAGVFETAWVRASSRYERTHGWMNRFRRILVRWEKRADTYVALLHLVFALITWRACGARD